MTNKPNAIAIPTAVAQRLGSYLEDKPWKDVNEFIQAIVSAPPVQIVQKDPVEPTGQEDMTPDTPPVETTPSENGKNRIEDQV